MEVELLHIVINYQSIEIMQTKKSRSGMVAAVDFANSKRQAYRSTQLQGYIYAKSPTITDSVTWIEYN